MGNGASKFSFWSDKKSKSENKEPTNSKIDKLKQDDVMMLYADCVSPHFGKSGLSFYAPFADVGESRRHKFNEISKLPSGSTKSLEREIVAEENMKQSLEEKRRKARITEEKRILVLRRRERKEVELRDRYQSKIKAAEERTRELQRRLRPPHSQVRPYINNDSNTIV